MAPSLLCRRGALAGGVSRSRLSTTAVSAAAATNAVPKNAATTASAGGTTPAAIAATPIKAMAPAAEPPPPSGNAAVRAGGPAEAGATPAPDSRPWPLRYWKGLLFASVAGSWVYSLVVQNHSRRLQQRLETEIAEQLPVNNDELLELRALNDVSTDSLSKLPGLLAASGQAASEPPTVIQAVTELVGHPIREAYAVERMLMALPRREDGGVEPMHTMSAMAFLSNGPVSERLEALYQTVAAPSGADGGLSRVAFSEMLGVMMHTGQLPVEKLVCVEDPGKNALGLSRSWYQTQPVHEFTGEELAMKAMEELHAEDGKAPGGESTATAAGDAAAGGAASRDDGATQQLVDRDTFVRLLQSNQVCLWGECYLIAERRRLKKQREEAEEYERNPPKWQFWKWGRKAAVQDDASAAETTFAPPGGAGG